MSERIHHGPADQPQAEARRLGFVTADVFTEQAFGGNPLAVFPAAGGLDDATMQAIARELNLSETVFVLPPADRAHTRRLRIFTPGTELPFAGHPTLGTAHVLVALGEVRPEAGRIARLVLEEGVGPVPVTVHCENGRPVHAELTAARAPETGPAAPDAAAVAAMLALEVGDLAGGGAGIEAVSSGVPFLIVPVRDREALGRARLRRDLWEQTLRAHWAPQVYLITRDVQRPDADLRARMFAPAMGIDEDPATGAAASALGGYLAARAGGDEAELSWTVEQGVEMGRPSLLQVTARRQGGAVTEVRVGGSSVMVAEGTMRIPAARANEGEAHERGEQP